MPKKAILKREKKWLQKYLGGRFAKFCHRTATPADSIHSPPHFCTKKYLFRRRTPPPPQLCIKRCQNHRKVATRHHFCTKKYHFRRKTPPPHNSAPKSARIVAKLPPGTLSASKNAISAAEPRHPAPFLHQKRPATFAHFNFFVYLYIGLNFKLT